MLSALQTRWHIESAMTAASAAICARPVYGRSGLEQVNGKPSPDSGPPDS
jgi:hypothetical protein